MPSMQLLQSRTHVECLHNKGAANTGLKLMLRDVDLITAAETIVRRKCSQVGGAGDMQCFASNPASWPDPLRIKTPTAPC